MDRRHRCTKASWQTLVCVCCALLFLPGCSFWGKSELSQYRDENKRLLADYRDQRDRTERLEVEKRALVTRIQDLEGRIAAISSALQNPASTSGSAGTGYLDPAVPSSSPFQPASQTLFPGPQVPATGPQGFGSQGPSLQGADAANQKRSDSRALDAWQVNDLDGVRK